MARDKIHEAVKNALIKDGWTITDDPLILLPEEDNIAIDLGAEKLLLAEKGVEKNRSRNQIFYSTLFNVRVPSGYWAVF
jgi:hypothetical protein